MKREKKKSTIVRILALILAALMVLGVLVSAVIGAQAEEVSGYSLRMYFHEDSQAFEVSQTLTYTNTTGHTLSCVRFHLFANQFRRLTTVPIPDADLSAAYPEGFAPGGVEFVSVQVNGSAANWGVSGDGEQLLRVSCSLKPGDSCVFRFDFYALLPTCRGRVGAGELDIRMAYFYPIAAVWSEEAGDFALTSQYALGESLLSEWASYDVEIDVPAPYIVAAPGEITEQPLPGNRKRVLIQAQCRQFAFTMSRRYSVRGQGDIQVYAADAPGSRRALNAAEKALSLLTQWLGPCPPVRVAQADITEESFCYPGLILIRSDLFSLSNRRELEWEIYRQIARQYFTCLVGIDPVSTPFLGDSLCEYAALLCFEAEGGREEYLSRLNELCLSALQTTLPGSLTVDAPLYAFQTPSEYDAVIRGRGCAVLHEMRSLMGEDSLLSGLSLYVSRFREKTAALSDFARALSDATGRSWDDLLISQMRDIGDYVHQDLDHYE